METLKLLEDVYLDMLLYMPATWRYTTEGQYRLASIRSAIADIRGVDSEEISDEFEEKIIKAKYSLV